MKKIFFIIGFVALVILMILGAIFLSRNIDQDNDKITIVSTLFPTYDFAKNIGGDKVAVTLLLPPGIEPHAFEPKPSDIAKINTADIFIYTGEFMEPWAHETIKSLDKEVKIVDASASIELIREEDADGEEQGGADPHIWLDFENAKTMAQNISRALQEIDPQNANYYQNNLENYEAELTALDNEYKHTLMTCQTKTIVYGGHYAFGYLAKRYDLEYVAAQGFSPDAEPTAKDMISLVEQIKKDNLNYIFYEELTSSKIAETLARETNAQLLLLNGAHNLTREDYENGVSFIMLMKNNLENFSSGLNCQKTL